MTPLRKLMIAICTLCTIFVIFVISFHQVFFTDLVAVALIAGASILFIIALTISAFKGIPRRFQ